MVESAKAAGVYTHELTGIKRDRIEIVTIREIIDGRKRLDLPLNLVALKKALADAEGDQLKLDLRPPSEAIIEQQPKKAVASVGREMPAKSRTR